MAVSVPLQTALILVVPAAEQAVARHRARYDVAARVGVPAHITIGYPFKPVDQLTAEDHSALREIFAGSGRFEITLARTSWFGDEVLYLEPSDADRLLALIRAVEAAFPDYPIYGGLHDEVVPHLTIGHATDRDLLAEAAEEVSGQLPIRQPVGSIELWAGPDPRAGVGRWAQVESYPLA